MLLRFCQRPLFTDGETLNERLLSAASGSPMNVHMSSGHVLDTARGQLLNNTKRRDSSNASGRCRFRKPRDEGLKTAR